MIEVEIVRLFKETELITLLRIDDGGRTRTEAAVVNSGDGRVVMRELGADINVFEAMFLERGGVMAVLGICDCAAVVFFVMKIIGRHEGEMF